MMGMDQDDILIAPWTTIKYRITGAGRCRRRAGLVHRQYARLRQGQQSSTSSTRARPSSIPSNRPSQKANTPMPIRFTNVDTILAKAASAERAKDAIAEITILLHERHRIRDGEDDDFTIRDMAEIINAMSSMTKMMGGLLMIVAMISLAVGGVGIMNIMLVSVTERTREIGLRMAVGARAKHILRQFLIESVVLCLFGGALGILLGSRRHAAGVVLPPLAGLGLDSGDRGGLRRLGRRGHCLRLLSGLEGLAARSDRRPAVRVAASWQPLPSRTSLLAACYAADRCNLLRCRALSCNALAGCVARCV